MSPAIDPQVPIPAPVQEDPVLELARAIRRDVAHELRGPVQSVVVNVEVARRRLTDGNVAGAAERFDLIELEVRRLHAVADAFLSLFCPVPEARTIFDIASVLDAMDPLVRVLARAARVQYDSAADTSLPLVHSRPEALALAFIRSAVTLGRACGPDGVLRIDTRATSATIDLVVTARAGKDGFAPDPEPGIERATLVANRWLQPDGGTVECVVGSDPMALRTIRIRLPRADMA